MILKQIGKAANLFPRLAYNVDETYRYCRIKTNYNSILINNFPFSTEEEIESYEAHIS